VLTGRMRKESHYGRGWKRALPFGGLTTLIVLALGGIAGGSPSYYARLPGPFKVSAYERSVDAHNLDASAWAAQTLSPNNGVASDIFTESMFSSLGHQAYVLGVANLFLTPTYGNADQRLVKEKRITLVVTDERTTEQLPAAGNYFSPDPRQGRYKKPLSRTDVNKFNDVPGISRIFDDGTIVVYDLRGAVHAK
jgi:hypothetical protein